MADCEVHVPGRDAPSPWCAACRMSSPADESTAGETLAALIGEKAALSYVESMWVAEAILASDWLAEYVDAEAERRARAYHDGACIWQRQAVDAALADVEQQIEALRHDAAIASPISFRTAKDEALAIVREARNGGASDG